MNIWPINMDSAYQPTAVCLLSLTTVTTAMQFHVIPFHYETKTSLDEWITLLVD